MSAPNHEHRVPGPRLIAIVGPFQSGKTSLLEGILVRGETDYESRGECRVSKRCPDDGCRGEDVTKVGNVLALVPPIGMPAALAAFDRPGPAYSALVQMSGGGR